MKLVIEEVHTKINSTSLTWYWRNKYIEYFKNGKLPSDPTESKTLRTKAARFTLANDGTLFRRTFDGPLEIVWDQEIPTTSYMRFMRALVGIIPVPIH